MVPFNTTAPASRFGTLRLACIPLQTPRIPKGARWARRSCKPQKSTASAGAGGVVSTTHILRGDCPLFLRAGKGDSPRMFHVILFEPGNTPEHRQRDPALRQHRRDAAPRAAARLHARRYPGEARGARLPRVCRACGSTRSLACCLGGAGRFPRVRTSRPRAPIATTSLSYRAGDAFLFGRETAGLPPEVLAGWPRDAECLRLPMLPGNRSLNLSNAVAVVVFEAWRQHGFAAGH